MADAKEDQNRDVLDDVLLNLARARVAFGAAVFASPRLSVRFMGLGRGTDSGRDYLTRMFAAREIALGVGYLLSDGSGRRTWARLGLLVDSLDVLGAVKARKGVPLWVTAGAVGAAGGYAAVGAAKAAKDLVR